MTESARALTKASTTAVSTYRRSSITSCNVRDTHIQVSDRAGLVRESCVQCSSRHCVANMCEAYGSKWQPHLVEVVINNSSRAARIGALV
jgi:hypothetical protein